jgi:molybdate transport system substrate-binding protein
MLPRQLTAATQKLGQVVFILSACLSGCSQSQKPTLFVAASLADVAATWQTEYGGGFECHSGASNLLAQQILVGAHADLFLAAGPQAVAPLMKAGLVERMDSSYLTNRLVLVCTQGIAPPDSLPDLLDPRFARIAVADPELAPAGDYARKGLEKAGLWESLRPHLIFTGDVRMAAQTVQLATADAAFIYATDLAAAGGGAGVELDSQLFPKAHYPLIMLTPLTPGKDSIWNYLHSEPARQVALAKGFQ